MYQLRLSSRYAQEHKEGNSANHTSKKKKGYLILMKTYQLWDRNIDIIAWYCKYHAGVRGG